LVSLNPVMLLGMWWALLVDARARGDRVSG